MTALQFLTRNGGYYSLEEIARAVGRPEEAVISELDKLCSAGRAVRREYRARRIVQQSGTWSACLTETREWQTLEQWRARHARATTQTRQAA